MLPALLVVVFGSYSFANGEEICQPLLTYLSRVNSSNTAKNVYKILKNEKPYLSAAFLESVAKKEGRWALLELAKIQESQLEKKRLLLEASNLPVTSLAGNEVSDEVEAELLQVAPSLIDHPPRELWLDVAKDFTQNRQYKKARIYYGRVWRGSFAVQQKIQALKGLRNVAKLEKKTAEHLSYSQELYLLSRKQGSKIGISESGLYYGRALWTANKPISAMVVLRALEKEAREPGDQAEIQYILGKIFAEKKQLAQARKHYRQAIALNNDPKYLWDLVWNLYQSKRYDEVVKEVQANVTERNHPERSRFRFWMGRAFKALRRNREANEVFQSIVNEDQFTYYALVARRELKIPLQMPDLAKESFLVRSNTIAPEYNKLLDQCGSRVADRYIQNEANKYSAAFVNLARAAAGFYLPLFGQTENRDLLWNNETELLFPLPYRKTIEENAKGVPLELIYAIMRQESAFNPLARSSADARGLLQVLPVHNSKGDLYDPIVNVKTGSRLLRRLLRLHKGKVIFVAAAYNAGPKPLFQWKRNLISKKRIRDPLTFIEEIPFDETRTYVRLILRNSVIYSARIGGKTQVEISEDLFSL